MDLSNLVAVSGKSGIFKMLSNKGNGLIVENLDTGKKGFVTARQHQFTPLESISIYTTDAEGGAELKTVFGNIKKHGGELPDPKSSSDDLRAYFTAVLPEHDQDQVHISDIKKIIKWFAFLDKHDLLAGDSEDEAEKGSDEEE